MESLGLMHCAALGFLIGLKLAHHHCLPMISRAGLAATQAALRLILIVSSSLDVLCWWYATMESAGPSPHSPRSLPSRVANQANDAATWVVKLWQRGVAGSMLSCRLASHI